MAACTWSAGCPPPCGWWSAAWSAWAGGATGSGAAVCRRATCTGSPRWAGSTSRSEEHTSELQSRPHLVSPLFPYTTLFRSLLPDHRRPVLRLLLALWPPAPGALAARHPVAGGRQPGRHGLVGLLAVAQQSAAGLPALDRPAGLALPLLPGAGAGEPLPHPPVRAARLARRPGPAAVAAWHGGPGGAALPARLAGVLLQGSLGGAPLRALHPLAHGAPARPAGAAAGQAPQRVLLRHLPGPPDVLQPGRPARPRPAPAAVALCAGPGRGGPGGLHRLEPGRQPHGVGRAALRQAVAGGVIPDKSHCYQPLPENSERGPVAIVTGGTCTRRSPWRGAPGGINETDDRPFLCRPAQRRPDVRHRSRPAGPGRRSRAAPGRRPGDGLLR